MRTMPSDFVVGDIYFAPLFVAALLGCCAAWATARLLNRFRISRFFAYPPVVFLALAVIYTVAAGTFIIPA